MKHSERKSAPNVKDGKVQKQNNWELTPDYYISEQPELVIDRQKPGDGYRHLFTQADIRRFISIIPHWKEHSRGLNAVVLAPAYKDYFGYYNPGVISLCAWSLDPAITVSDWYYKRRIGILECLHVLCLPEGNGDWLLQFDEETARAYLLLNTFLHELGHHNDYRNTRKPENANRGESHAEDFALQLGVQMWPSYQKAFGI
jgi:hypothetical protein